jgi:choline dehydrogenase
MAVVDLAGRVYGVEGLRVVDASIFPTGPHGNLHFPIVAAAEKIASDIRIPENVEQ